MLPVFDRLAEGIRRTGAALAVGIDPHPDLLPPGVGPIDGPEGAGTALADFGRRLVDAVAGIVPAVKIQVAFFERWGSPGWRGLETVVAHARSAGLFAIADAKRGDIGSTSTAYADGMLGAEGLAADAVTLHPYLGADAIEPFLAYAPDRGVFVLVRTTNPSAAEIQGLAAGDGPLYLEVGRRVAAWGADRKGEARFPPVGAVVAGTDPDAAGRLRALMPDTFFLVPGFGAQGGDARTVRACFLDDGTGAIVAASRSIAFAYREEPYASRFGPDRWAEAAAAACRDAADRLGI